MGRIDVEIPDELERTLRVKAVEKYGGRKGFLQKAVQTAIEKWIEVK